MQINAALSMRDAVPGVGIALLNRQGLVLGLKNGEKQGVHLHTAVVVPMGKGVLAALGITGAVPKIVIAFRDGGRDGRGVVDGQV